MEPESKVKSEEPAPYINHFSKDEDMIIEKALKILKEKMALPNTYLTSPNMADTYLTLKLKSLPYEVFGALVLDQRHGVIKDLELFRGTVDGATVYVRELLREIIPLNCNALVLYHNHPSGVSIPSEADKRITDRIKQAAEIFDIRVLDHIIIAEETYSFAEKGLI